MSVDLARQWARTDDVLPVLEQHVVDAQNAVVAARQERQQLHEALLKSIGVSRPIRVFLLPAGDVVIVDALIGLRRVRVERPDEPTGALCEHLLRETE